MHAIRFATALFLAAFCWTAVAPAQESPAGDDPFSLVRPLSGVWKGESHGFGATSTVTHRWEFVLDGNFLRLSTRSIPQPNGDDPDAGPRVHEDVGYVGYSEGDGRLRFHQFLTEGFVNEFLLEPAEPPEIGIDFEPVRTAGMDEYNVRMTLRFDGDDAYEMVLELGTKGEELKACQTMRLTRLE